MRKSTTTVQLRRRVKKLSKALHEVCDLAIWMSGAPDFGTGGQASEYWEKNRVRVIRALMLAEESKCDA